MVRRGDLGWVFPGSWIISCHLKWISCGWFFGRGCRKNTRDCVERIPFRHICCHLDAQGTVYLNRDLQNQAVGDGFEAGRRSGMELLVNQFN